MWMRAGVRTSTASGAGADGASSDMRARRGRRSSEARRSADLSIDDRPARSAGGRAIRQERERLHLIDALFAVERQINGASPDERLAVRRQQSAPIIAELEAWMDETRQQLTSSHHIVKAINYLKRRWPSFTRFQDDGRVCLSNNAAERALRGIALGRKSWLFAGSDRGGQRAAALYSLIATAKLNNVDPQAWLADVLARINDLPASRLDELLPWNWDPAQARAKTAA